MIKFRLYYDKDKETDWLNGLAASGLELEGFCLGFYKFSQGEPGRYRYQIDFSGSFFSVGSDYREFMEEQGIELVAVWGPWVILRKLANEKDFQLYSDNASLISHYEKIRKMFKVFSILLYISFMMEVFVAATLHDPFFYIAMVAIGALALVFLNIAARLTNTIDRLREEDGIAPRRRRRPNLLMALGMLLSGSASVMQDVMALPVMRTLQIIGIVLIWIGLFRTIRTPNT
ncbi:MAG: DUF2812 domain-containing protein [Blautia sp.]|nr:DUF2812 domain-containing protein [Blautia sp.]